MEDGERERQMSGAQSGKLIIGSRGSELAFWQSNWVKSQLQQNSPDLEIEIAVIRTKGDKILDSPLSQVGGKGVFTREIDEALLEGKIDLSVHSLKDLPTAVPDGLTIAAITQREDVHDVFVCHPKKSCNRLEDLPRGARVSTGSLRRRCQLLHYRPDLEIVEIRGNVPTRLKKLDESDWDGLILAHAGLLRLGMGHRATEIISTDTILPAVGQGAIAVEVRDDDERVKKIVAAINHEPTAIATIAERTLLQRLQGGCQVPIGAYARVEDSIFKMDALLGSLDGRRVVKSTIHGEPSHATALAQTLADTLLKGGGEKILREIRPLSTAEVPAA